MIKYVIGLALFGPFAANAQDKFPSITGETAEGRAVTIPGDDNGFTLVALAFGKGAEPSLQEWMGPAYLRFVAKHGLFAGSYECKAWFVPVFVGLDKAAYEPSMRRLRKSGDPELVEHVLFFKGEFDAIQAQLGLRRSDIPYFFVLDREGRILHRAEGVFSEDKLDEMEEVMME